MKLYAYIIYIARRAMVLVGNEKNETWFAFALVGGFEMYLVIDLIYVATVIWKLNLSGEEIPTAIFAIAIVGLVNYFFIYRGQVYKRHDDEFDRYSASKHALFTTMSVILCVVIVVASAYVPSVLHRT